MADRCIKARFHRIGVPNANIAVESDGTALGMIAVSVRIVSRQCDIGVAPGCRKASRGLPSDRRETPAIQPEFETWRGAACGCHGINRRSEEHTSELQSLMRISYAVFCLKKKKQTIANTKYQSK